MRSPLNTAEYRIRLGLQNQSPHCLRTTRPGFAPVCWPSFITTTQFRITYRIPTGSRPRATSRPARCALSGLREPLRAVKPGITGPVDNAAAGQNQVVRRGFLTGAPGGAHKAPKASARHRPRNGLRSRFCRLHGRDPLLHLPGQVRDHSQHALHRHELSAVMHFVLLEPEQHLEAGFERRRHALRE